MYLKKLILLGSVFLAFPAFAQVVGTPTWNPDYEREHGLQNQPISAEDFEEIENSEVTPVGEPEAPRANKSPWWDFIGPIGPIGVDGATAWDFGPKAPPSPQGATRTPWDFTPPKVPTPVGSNVKTLHAKGVHSCFSDEALFNCYVSIADAIDCNEAGIRLKLMSCCNGHIFRGKKVTNAHSTNFILTKCGPYGSDKEEL